MQTVLVAAPQMDPPLSTIISFPNLGEFCMILKAVTTFVIQIIHVSEPGNLESISFLKFSIDLPSPLTLNDIKQTMQTCPPRVLFLRRKRAVIRLPGVI